MRESEALYRLLAENSTDLISKHTPEGVYTYASPASRALLGYEPEELVGCSAYDFFHPDDLKEISESHSAVVEEQDTFTVSYRIRCKNGEYRWFETTSRAVRNEASGEMQEIIAVSRDITDRLRIEAGLQEAERRYRTLVEQVPAVIYTGENLANPYSTKYVSPQITDLLGYTPEDFIENPDLWRETLHLEDRDRVLAEAARAAEAGEQFNAEYRMFCRNGEEIWVQDEAMLVRDEAGRPRFWQGVKIDVTEQKKVESQLRESSDRITSILESTTDAFFALDHHQRFTFVNRRAEQFLQQPREELLGSSVVDAFPEATNSQFYAECQKAAVSRKEVHFEEFYAPLGKWFEVHVYPYKEGLAVYFQDLTERVEGERQLREAEERFRSAFDNTPVGMAIVGPEGRYVQANRAFCELLGYSEEELFEKTYIGITYPEDYEISVDHARRLDSGALDGYTLEKRYIHADGHPVWVSLSISLVRNADDEPLYYISQIQSIEERKQAEVALREDAERLSAIIATQRAIALAEPNQEAVMKLIVERSQELTEADGATVEMIEGEELVYRNASGRARDHIGLRLHSSSSISGECVRRKEILRSDDTVQDPRVDQAAVRKTGARSMIVVPLYHRQEIVGVLKVFSTKPQAFCNRDVDTLQLMAGLIAAAMSHTAEFEAKQALLDERTASLMQIQQSEARFRAIFEGTTAGIAIVSLDGQLFQTNPALQALLGYDEQELKDMYFTDITHPDDIEKDLKLYKELAEGKRDGYQIEKRYIRKDGSLLWGRLNASPIHTPEGGSRFMVGIVEDITDRRQAEEEIRKRAQQQAIVANLGQRALAQTDLRALMDEAVNLVVQDLGVEYCAILELLQEENCLLLQAGVGWKAGLVGRDTVEVGEDSPAGQLLLTKKPLVFEDLSKDPHFSKVQNLREHGVVSGVSVTIQGPEGPFGLLGAHATQKRKFSGDDINFLQAVANVLSAAFERARAEEALKRSERLSRSAINSLSAHIAILDESGNIIDVNKGWRRFATSNAPMVGDLDEGANYLKVCDSATGAEAEAATAFARGIRDVLSYRRESFEIEYPCHAPDKQRWFVGRVTRFPDTDPPRVVVAHEDISVRKLSEEAVRKSEQEYRKLFELANDAILIYEPESREILDVNQNACEIYGYLRETFIGMSMRELSMDRQRGRRYLETLLSRGAYQDFETVHRRNDGKPMDVLVNSSVIEFRGQQAVLSISRDITARKRTEASLLEIREAERRRIARDLHDAVLQDLAGTLQGIQAFEMESKGTGGEVGLEQEIAALRRATGGLRNAIYDLRNEQDEPFIKAVESLVEFNRQLTPERQINLVVSEGFSPELKDGVSVELLRVLQEALANTRQHSDARKIKISLCRRKNEVLAQIYDDGCGFDAGTVQGGVGLSGMRERVAEMGGKIEVETESGRGTLIKVSVPYKGADKER